MDGYAVDLHLALRRDEDVLLTVEGTGLHQGAVLGRDLDGHVGHGQLDWKLRNDPRVVCMEKTNIRYVVPEDLGEPADFSSIDVSFISLTKVLLPVRNLLTDEGEIVCLIKPQFEAGL